MEAKKEKKLHTSKNLENLQFKTNKDSQNRFRTRNQDNKRDVRKIKQQVFKRMAQARASQLIL